MKLKKYKFLSIAIFLFVCVCSFSIFLADNNTTTIDVTYLSANEEAEHQHIYKSNYDNSSHWEECVVCKIQKNISGHNLQLIGNAPTCDVYVQLGKYICSDNCGYSRKAEKLSHIRPEIPTYKDHLNSQHLCFECKRCGGGGSNSFGGVHRFNINGTIIAPYHGNFQGLDVHSLGTRTCIECHLSVDLSQHVFYSHVCTICTKSLGPEGLSTSPYNKTVNGVVQVDLINNDMQYVYYKVDVKNLPNIRQASGYSLKGGNFIIGNPEFVIQEGTYQTFRYPISLKDRNIPITENLEILARVHAKTQGMVDSNGVVYSRDTNSENIIAVNVDQSKPVINSIDTKDITTSNGWATAKQITVKGSSTMNSIVYISMYYPDGTPIFERNACSVVNGNYVYNIIPELEVSDPKDFIIYVEDDFGNKSQKNINLSKVDAKAPQISSSLTTDKNWSKNKEFAIETIDNGVGDVLISFNNQNDYHSSMKSDNKFTKTFDFVGDCYGSNDAMIYAKDLLGNIISSKLTIHNIDNTTPTITSNTNHILDDLRPFATLNIDANDINPTLNKSGSGVVKYAISKENKESSISQWQDSSSFKITDNGTYYIYAKDLVGNVSKPYEYNIDNIHYGNITLKINKSIEHENILLDNESLVSSFGVNTNTNQFQILLLGKDTNTISKGLIKSNSTILFEKLNIGTYELVEFEKKGFDFQSFEVNFSDSYLSFFQENDKYYIKVSDILNVDQEIVIDSKSNIEEPIIMGDVVMKENFIIL